MFEKKRNQEIYKRDFSGYYKPSNVNFSAGAVCAIMSDIAPCDAVVGQLNLMIPAKWQLVPGRQRTKRFILEGRMELMLSSQKNR